MKEINKYKLKHMNNVAIHMAKMAHLFGISKEEAYVLGYLHDIGYIKGRTNHEYSGYEIISNMGLDKKYKDAIKLHGKSPKEIDKKEITPYLICLWDGDMSIDAKGNEVGWRGRLNDIIKRYGKDSDAYKTAYETIDFLRKYLKNRN